jgi:VWFA-related protein
VLGLAMVAGALWGPDARLSSAALDAEVASTRTVRFDLVATDGRGRSVDSLGPSDFELRDEGVLQSLDAAQVIRLDPASPAEPLASITSDVDERVEAQRPNTRLIAIFLDEYHVGAASAARVRAALTRFVADELSPRDLLVVMRPLDSLFTIRLTRDRARAQDEIQAFEGRQGDYRPRSAYERNYMAGTPARIDGSRAQVTASALNALALHLGTLNPDTRKTLVIVSEGLPRVDRRRGLEGLPTLDTVARSANRYNVSVYPIDPREPVQTALAAQNETLSTLALSTSGRAIAQAADLSERMQRIAEDSTAYYLLVYTTRQPSDGKFHRVIVSVKAPGIGIRARTGYWATPPDDELRASLMRPRAAVPLEPARHLSPYIRPWFGMARGEGGRTRVTFVWEPAARVPGTKQPSAARVLLKALGADGSALFEGLVRPTGPLRPDGHEESEARAEFDASPGPLRLRMSIEDQSQQTIDSDVREIAVRDLSRPIVLGTPAVFRGRTARDFRAFEHEGDASSAPTPVASREFSRTEHVVIRVPVYAPTDVAVTVSARLLNPKNQPVRTLDARMLAGRDTVCDIDLPLAGFAVGEYRVEIVAKTPAAAANDTLDLRITN